jgi:hypothetical protein
MTLLTKWGLIDWRSKYGVVPISLLDIGTRTIQLANARGSDSFSEIA